MIEPLAAPDGHPIYPIENPRLARTIRSFMTYAKGNQLVSSDLKKRLESGIAGDFNFRHSIFLDYWKKFGWNGNVLLAKIRRTG